MLINCPRCGFQQPKDKYCAQCGVDMESFKPATQPAWKKFFGNPLIQLSLLVAVAGGLGVTLYQKGQQNLERRVSMLSAPVQINSTTSPASTSTPETAENFAPPPTEQASQTPDTPEAASGVVNAYKVSPPTPPPVAAETEAETNKDAKALAKSSAPHLIVYYAEVSRGSLNGLYAASRSTGQFMNFNDYSAGIVPNIRRSIGAPQTKILHTENRTLESAKTLQWTYGLKDRRDPSVEIGLTTFFELNEMDATNLRGNLEIQRTWKEASASGAPEVQRKSFPAIFEIGGDTGFFMAGVLPSQSNLENEDELTSIEVFKILKSPQFRAGESELVIFVEFEKGN